VNKYDPSAIGSDIPRSFAQCVVRQLAFFLVKILGLNKAGFFSTEVVQQINPICSIQTKFGKLYCKGGHGRLRWRALTFYSEEPNTVKWLESLSEEDLLWDVGANVGLYSIYAAKYAKCKVLAIEPEAQNFAILVENIVLNKIQDYVEVMNVAITNNFGFGKLLVHSLTKGGAYNFFTFEPTNDTEITQRQIGISLDDLSLRFGFKWPTYLKIDVDGNEPEIIQGAQFLLKSGQLKSLLIEVQKNHPAHVQMIEIILAAGYECISNRSNWESRRNRTRENERPTTNMILIKKT